MAVHSRDIAPTHPPRRGLLVPPIDRENLDRAAPWLRLLFGVAIIAFDSNNTIVGVAADTTPWELPIIAGISGNIWVGVGVAAFFSLGEWLTSEQAPYIYICFLLANAWYNYRQIGEPIRLLADYHIHDGTIALVVAFVLSWMLAIAIARYGEILLFGKRKKRE